MSVHAILIGLAIVFTGIGDEMLGLLARSGMVMRRPVGLLLISAGLASQWFTPPAFAASALIASLAFAVALLNPRRDARAEFPGAAALFAVILYVAGLYQILALAIRQGLSAEVALLYASLALRDAGAAVYGRFYSGKSISSVSPAKTYQGAFVGAAAALIFWVTLASWLQFSYGYAALQGLSAGLFGQMGDLVESAAKRWAGAKHSGTVFGGRGGLLDLLDSLLFTLPSWYIIAVFSARLA